MIRIPHNTSIIGELRSEGNMEVLGRIEGDSDIKGLLIVGKECVWVGKAIADTIIVEGIVEGSVIARKKVEIAPSAQITGSIISPTVLIAKSAKLNCDIQMNKAKDTIDLEGHRQQRHWSIPSINKSTPDSSKHNIA